MFLAVTLKLFQPRSGGMFLAVTLKLLVYARLAGRLQPSSGARGAAGRGTSCPRVKSRPSSILRLKGMSYLVAVPRTGGIRE